MRTDNGERLRLEVQAVQAFLPWPRISEMVADQWRAVGIQADVKDEWRVGLLAAFRELLLNAMEHGAGFGTERTIEVSAVQTQRAIVFHFRDPGQGFSFEELGHAAISNPATDPLHHTTRRDELGLRPGGFGILIARRVADELYYNEAGNQVLLIKHIA